MSNPWEEIDLNDYENHMSLSSVFQLQTMNQMMKEQFYTYPHDIRHSRREWIGTYRQTDFRQGLRR